MWWLLTRSPKNEKKGGNLGAKRSVTSTGICLVMSDKPGVCTERGSEGVLVAKEPTTEAFRALSTVGSEIKTASPPLQRMGWIPCRPASSKAYSTHRGISSYNVLVLSLSPQHQPKLNSLGPLKLGDRAQHGILNWVLFDIRMLLGACCLHLISWSDILVNNKGPSLIFP